MFYCAIMLRERKECDDCVVSTWPTAQNYDDKYLSDMEMTQIIVSSIKTSLLQQDQIFDVCMICMINRTVTCEKVQVYNN